jgi:hypothetical protein
MGGTVYISFTLVVKTDMRSPHGVHAGQWATKTWREVYGGRTFCPDVVETREAKRVHIAPSVVLV